jgi:hypothetical protein
LPSNSPRTHQKLNTTVAQQRVLRTDPKEQITFQFFQKYK